MIDIDLLACMYILREGREISNLVNRSKGIASKFINADG